MSGLNGTLQIEVSIAPATSRKGGQRRNTAGPSCPTRRAFRESRA